MYFEDIKMWGFGAVLSYIKDCHVAVRLNQSTVIKAKISDGCQPMGHLALYTED